MLLDYEKEHIDYLRDNACESTLFLKKNGDFPLAKPENIALFGSGVRHTVKGGTGSGDVVSRDFKTIEEAFIENGFNITTKEWLDKYDEFRKSTFIDHVKKVKKEAKKYKVMPAVFSMGYFEEEKNYDIEVDKYQGDTCIYVLTRNSGEGSDRKNIKGDVKLSDKEVADILYLNDKYKRFMLVLNVGGVIDLSPVINVSNILLLSQLGVKTSETLVDIILGNKNPSGKLATTWAKPEDYPSYENFGDLNDTYYKEGIYVGYRYFNTVNKGILFPFGFGLSYTDFKITLVDKSFDNNILNIKCNIRNIGKFGGKEVIECYVTKPNDKIDNPYIELINYKKTNYLKPDEEETIELSIDVRNLKSYLADISSYVLLKGEFIIRIGNSSVNLTNVCKLINNEEIILEKLNNKCHNNEFNDLKLDRIKEDLNDLDIFNIINNYETKIVEYKKDTYIDEKIKDLSIYELALICLGHHESGIASIVGASSKHVIGGAGETVLKVDKIKEYLTMADGPQGLRLKQTYGIDEKGIYDISIDPIMENMLIYLPKIARPFIRPPKNRHGKIYHQYTTAIPIATALAQSFNESFVKGCAKIVKEEMKLFNVNLWLAPALNIHRNILCGRNFEYYSEDPYLSGMMAKSMTEGIEDEGLGVTLKHFACNNQEFNRNNNNSHLSERALREIYLKGFEISIKEAKPKALMTSYNLINGIHTSESYELINDILRCEWGYSGLVMTDWIKSGRSFSKKSKYPAPYASNNIKAGNDLTMPGSSKDFNDIVKEVKKGKLSKEDLIYSASRIYRSIIKNNTRE